MVQSDAEIINIVLNGEKQMFAELVRRYEKPVRAVGLEILGDHHLAGDVSQDTFIRAYQKLGTLRKPQSFGPWLMKIARRFAIESDQHQQKELRAKTAADVIEKPNGQIDEEKRWILTAIAKLPKAEQQVIMLHYLGQNSVGDVAKILDRSVGTVTKQLSRARIRLRKILERQEK